MLVLPTAVLEHVTDTGVHHDWLLGDPADPAGRLWTARVGPPSRFWPALGRWDLHETAPHRRRYLQFEGDIGAGRGRVRRIDAGTVSARLWTASRRVIDLRLCGWAGRVELRRIAGPTWRAAWC